MNQDIIALLIVYIAIIYALVMIYINITNAMKPGKKCNGACSGCKIDLSKIEFGDNKK